MSLTNNSSGCSRIPTEAKKVFVETRDDDCPRVRYSFLSPRAQIQRAASAGKACAYRCAYRYAALTSALLGFSTCTSVESIVTQTVSSDQGMEPDGSTDQTASNWAW